MSVWWGWCAEERPQPEAAARQDGCPACFPNLAGLAPAPDTPAHRKQSGGTGPPTEHGVDAEDVEAGAGKGGHIQQKAEHHARRHRRLGKPPSRCGAGSRWSHSQRGMQDGTAPASEWRAGWHHISLSTACRVAPARPGRGMPAAAGWQRSRWGLVAQRAQHSMLSTHLSSKRAGSPWPSNFCWEGRRRCAAAGGAAGTSGSE